MILEHSNYRNFLKDALASRQRKNPSFSMRAFAQLLEISQPAVSQIFSGKKNISLDTALTIGSKLGLNEKETEYFCLLVQLETAKTPMTKETIIKKINTINPKRPVHELSVEFFRAISDWYHMAIRNMTDLHGHELTPQLISKRLGITRLEAETALDRLCRLELIEKDERHPNHYRKVQDYVIAKSASPSEALRNFHRQMMDKAIESLYTQTPQEKVVGSETFAICENHLQEASEITEAYFQKMLSLAKKPGKKTQVYHLGVQFFNLTKEKK